MTILLCVSSTTFASIGTDTIRHELRTEWIYPGEFEAIPPSRLNLIPSFSTGIHGCIRYPLDTPGFRTKCSYKDAFLASGHDISIIESREHGYVVSHLAMGPSLIPDMAPW